VLHRLVELLLAIEGQADRNSMGAEALSKMFTPNVTSRETQEDWMNAMVRTKLLLLVPVLVLLLVLTSLLL